MTSTRDALSLRLHVIYSDPADYPGQFVARGWTIRGHAAIPDREPLVVSDNLSEVRKAVPPEATRIPRHPSDDRAILEVWL